MTPLSLFSDVITFNEHFFNTPFGIYGADTYIQKLDFLIKLCCEKETWKFYLSDVKAKRIKLNLLVMFLLCMYTIVKQFEETEMVWVTFDLYVATDFVE